MATDTHAFSPQELTRLLCRGLSRLAVAAQGGDERLDALLAELRHFLRGDMRDLVQLGAVIGKIEERIREVDLDRNQQADLLQQALEQLLGQLQALPLSGGQGRALGQFRRGLDRTALQQPGPLLCRYAALQGELLQTAAITATAPRRAGWWWRLLPSRGGRSEATVAAPVPVVAEVDSLTPDAPEQGQDLLSVPMVTAAVGQLLAELLRQLDPPAPSRQLHQSLQAQLSAGLSWYGLVPTLEQVSLMVLAVLEHDRGQFQHFLLQLNQKLAEQHQALARSRQHQQARADADGELDVAVRGEVNALKGQMVGATTLEQLKLDVASRLDSIVGAMDCHRHTEQARQAELQHQLTLMADRLRAMEEGAAQLEQHVAEQRRMALLDPLTQLPNRRAYEERMQQEFERWQRYQRPLTLAICYADNFKSINDSYGHLAGDKVLRILAGTLRDRLRKSDFVARYGGEEFVVVMPETDGQQALKALDTLRLAVAECPFHFREQPVPVTLSVGIACFGAGDRPDDVFERADSALARAKRAGRNQCQLAGEAGPVAV
jgi:diguanylate cyclase